uniref:Uncharacterized protein n=1 Tax=Pararge aegeria TaxID=116150 RepID=S4PAM8_9NEOP
MFLGVSNKITLKAFNLSLWILSASFYGFDKRSIVNQMGTPTFFHFAFVYPFLAKGLVLHVCTCYSGVYGIT